jgi:hypothetical protein
MGQGGDVVANVWRHSLVPLPAERMARKDVHSWRMAHFCVSGVLPR